MSVSSFEDVTRSRPERSLLVALKKHSGRNVTGKITVRHRGGGHKRIYRVIDFKRDKVDVPGRIAAIEYDPHRSARIALVHYRDGDKRYIVAPEGLAMGDMIMAGENAEIRPGNALPLSRIPLGTTVHNLEVQLGRGGQLVRSAGVGAQLVAREGRYAQMRMPSGEVRLIDVRCRATIGQVGNSDYFNISWGKAGRSRHRGIRPINRGVSRNPVDHPNGGGAGKSKSGGGWQQLTSPWGLLAKGYRTRNKRKYSNRFILVRRDGRPMKRK